MNVKQQIKVFQCQRILTAACVVWQCEAEVIKISRFIPASYLKANPIRKIYKARDKDNTVQTLYRRRTTETNLTILRILLVEQRHVCVATTANNKVRHTYVYLLTCQATWNSTSFLLCSTRLKDSTNFSALHSQQPLFHQPQNPI